MTFIPNDNPFALKAVETYRGVVYPWVIDHVGHVNVQSYVARFDEASWQFLTRVTVARFGADEQVAEVVRPTSSPPGMDTANDALRRTQRMGSPR